MIIISGPSTIGKNPLIYKICEIYDFSYVTPYTTRKKRREELNGKDYTFLSKMEFQSKIQNKEMTEWDYCLEHYYGYMYDFPGNVCHITHGLSRMALRIKAKYPHDITTIFLMPDSKERIFDNLKQHLREALVEEEICHSAMFDKIFICPKNPLDLLNKEEIVQFILTEKKTI